MGAVLQRPVEEPVHVAVGAVVGPGEQKNLHVDRRHDLQELVGRVASRLRLAEHVGQLDELVDLLRALLLTQVLPVRRELASVERVAVDAHRLQEAEVGSGRAREHVEAQAAQLELARRGAEDLARLLEHVVYEGARLVVDQPPAPAALVATRLEEVQNRGSSCTRVSTGPNRSPSRSTRARTSSCSNTSSDGSPASRQASTSSHATGVETVGLSFARSEYTFTVVLCSSFWLQSTSTFPGRNSFDIRETTRSGCCFSSSSATALANGFVSS